MFGNTLKDQRLGSGRELVMDAFYYECVGDQSLDDICECVLRKLLGALGADFKEAKDLRQRLIEHGKRLQDKAQEAGITPGMDFMEPYVGRLVVEDVLKKSNKRIAINKKNIEMRLDITFAEFSNRRPFSDEWKKVLGDDKTYCIDDICVNIVIYRVGKFSYVAAEPWFIYFKDEKGNCAMRNW